MPKAKGAKKSGKKDRSKAANAPSAAANANSSAQQPASAIATSSGSAHIGVAEALSTVERHIDALKTITIRKSSSGAEVSSSDRRFSPHETREVLTAAAFVMLSLQCTEKHLSNEDPAKDQALVAQLETVKTVMAQLERATDANSKAQNTSEIRPGIRYPYRPWASNASGRFLVKARSCGRTLRGGSRFLLRSRIESSSPPSRIVAG